MLKRGPQLVQLVKGVAVAAVGRIEHLGQTVGAGGDVGQNEDGFGPVVVAAPDFEPVVTGRLKPGRIQAVDNGAGRLFRRKAIQEMGQIGLGAVNLNENAAGIVDNPTGQIQIGGQPVHEGAKANALNSAMNFDPQTLPGRYRYCPCAQRSAPHFLLTGRAG